jgi:hypothetical protein
MTTAHEVYFLTRETRPWAEGNHPVAGHASVRQGLLTDVEDAYAPRGAYACIPEDFWRT